MEIYEEEEYLEKYPVTDDIVRGYLNDFGIDISKYYFSQFNKFEYNSNEFHSVTYGHNKNENVSLFFCFMFDGEEVVLEQLNLSND